MRAKTAAVTAAMAMVVPALAIAEVGPHSNWYSTNKHFHGIGAGAINIVYQRDKGKADVNGGFSCLGTFSQSGKTYDESFDMYPVDVSHGKIDFQGTVKVYSNSPNPTQVAMHLTATLKAKKATGSVSFQGTKCGTIHFKAKLAKRTK